MIMSSLSLAPRLSPPTWYLTSREWRHNTRMTGALSCYISTKRQSICWGDHHRDQEWCWTSQAEKTCSVRLRLVWGLVKTSQPSLCIRLGHVLVHVVGTIVTQSVSAQQELAYVSKLTKCPISQFKMHCTPSQCSGLVSLLYMQKWSME